MMIVQQSPIFNRLGSKTDMQSPVTSTSITNSKVRITGTKAVAVPIVKRPLLGKTVKNLKQRLGKFSCNLLNLLKLEFREFSIEHYHKKYIFFLNVLNPLKLGFCEFANKYYKISK